MKLNKYTCIISVCMHTRINNQQVLRARTLLRLVVTFELSCIFCTPTDFVSCENETRWNHYQSRDRLDIFGYSAAMLLTLILFGLFKVIMAPIDNLLR